EEKGIRILGKLVHEKLLAGEGVIVHCAGGRGRTGTVLGVVLRRFGFSAREVVDYLDEIHLAREKAGWPEASWQREVVER
ncbi:MAG: tyrosine-protein phosphatase, partial [Verrucomicrobiae bacterium]|nr:tyrosine-protein phosphatase [Verrucomicrobiae bacterium]